MVTLKNIIRHNSIIECDYYPEDYDKCGHIIYDTVSEKSDINFVDYNNSPKTYAIHAFKRLKQIAFLKEIPQQSVVMWY